MNSRPLGAPLGSPRVKNPPAKAGDSGSVPGFEWQPTPGCWPGKSHRQRSLPAAVHGGTPEESAMTEQVSSTSSRPLCGAQVVREERGRLTLGLSEMRRFLRSCCRVWGLSVCEERSVGPRKLRSGAFPVAACQRCHWPPTSPGCSLRPWPKLRSPGSWASLYCSYETGWWPRWLTALRLNERVRGHLSLKCCLESRFLL